MTSSKQKQTSIQILNTMVYNMSALSEWQANKGGTPDPEPVVLACMDPYQTRILSRDDQLLLAVNNISFQEVKDTQGPVNGWERSEGGLMEGWKGVSFRAMFSLNGGDRLAMRNVIESSRLAEDKRLVIPFVMGDTDEAGNVVAPPEGTQPDTLTLTMPYGSGDGLVLRFAYRDHDEDFGDFPCVVIDVALSVERQTPLGSGSYTPAMRWDYSVILNSPNGRTPSDSLSRRRYDATKSLVRSALSALGVAPVAVGR